MGARLAIGAGLVGALLLFVATSRLTAPAPAGSSRGPAPEASGVADAPTAALDAPDLPPLPPSLDGTAVDGGFVVDADGRLRVTTDAIDLFDYFLSASGEESLARIRARIEQEIRTRLPASAQPDALDLLERYLAYREALQELTTREDLLAASLERRLQRIRELRREHFDATEREALFAAEEERWRMDLARRRVATDPDLDPEERSRRLAAIDAELPDAVREVRETALAAVRLRDDEAALRERGASEAEIHALRERRFGPEAASRLAVLDARRARWDARVDAWIREREALLDEGVSPEEIAERRAERFSGPELTRAIALEQLGESR